MNIFKNKFLYIGVPVLVLVIAIIFVLNGTVVRSPEKEVPLPPEENIINLEGKIISTPNGSQFDDYFVSTDGQEYGIEAFGIKKDIQDKIISFRDSGKMVLIEGNLVTDVIDYGTRQIQVKVIQEKKEAPLGIANPASAYCEKQGGKLEIKNTEQGQIGVCIFSKGECEEWAYFRGECTPEEGNITLENCGPIDENQGITCAQVDQPVCARIADENSDPAWKTFSNNCVACISGEVTLGYKEGACK
jgi:hypothetical protein